MQSQKRAKENKMSKRKKKGARSARRRAALKGFAKGKFQSPVHSNGFKQDVLIDMYKGDIGITGGGAGAAAIAADAAGKTYFRYNGQPYRVIQSPRGPGGQAFTRAGKVK